MKARPLLLASLTLFGFLVACSSQNANTSAGSVTTTPHVATPAPSQSVAADGESNTPTPEQGTYVSPVLGFRIKIPTAMSAAETPSCHPAESVDGTQVSLGPNLSIRVSSADAITPSEAATTFLARLNAVAEKTSTVEVSGATAVRIEYRLQAGARFGVATFVVHNAKLFALVFEARDVSQCAGPELYDSIVSSFQFLP